MNFFQILSQMAAGVDVTLRIKEKNGNLTVMVTPEAGNKSSIKGRVITGTPEDLDTGFFTAITPVIEQAKAAVIHDLTAEEKPEPEQKTEKATTSKANKKAGKKSAKKKAPPGKKPVPAVQPASMFDQPEETPEPETVPVPEGESEEPNEADEQTDSETE